MPGKRAPATWGPWGDAAQALEWSSLAALTAVRTRLAPAAAASPVWCNVRGSIRGRMGARGGGSPVSPLPLLAGHGPAGEAARAGRAAQPWLPTLRSPPGAGLMERIQAIAQNVSDIAVKVDQILRHSLLLHSKGGARRPWTPGGGGAGRDIRAGAPTSPQQPPGLARALF